MFIAFNIALGSTPWASGFEIGIFLNQVFMGVTRFLLLINHCQLFYCCYFACRLTRDKCTGF